MDLCNELSFIWVAGWQAAWEKRLHWTLHTNFSTNFFIPTMPTGTVDFCHFILLSLTLTWGRGKGRVEGVTRLRFLAHFSNDRDRI